MLALTHFFDFHGHSNTATHEPTHEPTIAPTTSATETPSDAPEVEFPGADIPSTSVPDKFIDEILADDGRFTTLVTLVDEAGLTGAISGEDSITVFAPTDEAFANLGDVDVSPDELKNILLYHASPGVVILGSKTITMANELEAILVVSEEEVKINDADISEAVEAFNGAIYVINKVLIPSAGEGEAVTEITPDDLRR